MSYLNGQWLLKNSPMEDSQQCPQFDSKALVQQFKQHSSLFLLVLIGIPLQLLFLWL